MKVLIDTGNGYQDYTRYVVDGTLTLTDSINVPTLLNFVLSPSDNSFVVPRRSSYVRVVSERYASGNNGYGEGKVLATGFITNEPERQYLGLNPVLPQFHQQQLAYIIHVTSDDWLLNTRTVPYIPAFINQTEGQILASIADTLIPGFFDVTSFVASGDLVPYYQYSPDKTWSDVAKDFGDSIRYRWKVLDRVVYFQPFGDGPLGVQYDEDTLSDPELFPLQLSTSVITVPPVNDATVIGDIEPQTNWDSYFIGDGFSSQFRLKHKVFDGETALLLQDDWTESDFQTNLWNIQDPLGVMSLAGALNITQLGSPTPLGDTYILGVNGLELGGGLNLTHGEFEFTDECEGIVGGIYLDTSLTLNNCVAGFGLTSVSGGVVVTASGAGGIVMQPIFNGLYVGPQIVSQPNHHYILQTWIGAEKWDRYQRVYRNLTGSVSYGGNDLSASGTITWVITDVDLGIYATTIPSLQSTIQPAITKFSVTQQDLPEFVTYAPINAENLNLVLVNSLVAQPPEGSLYVQALTGATGLQLPVLPDQLGDEIHYLLGFGQQNQTATVLVNGDTQYLAFYDDSIPGVGSRIRYQSWAAQQSVGRVRDPIAVMNEAVVSGDDGVRSAIFSNLAPVPRTSEECELAAAAAIHDREYPQFQGTYTVQTDPYRFESLMNPGIYNYPVAGRMLYINSTVRAVTGQNFFVNSVTTNVNELKDEVLEFSISYGPDLYLERTLRNFEQRSDNILRPQETAPQVNFVALADVGTAFLPMLDSAQITSIDNSLAQGNTVSVDLGVTLSGGVFCEVRRTDTGWGQNDGNRIGLFADSIFTLPRTNRDQTYYLRQLNNAGLFSRFSKALRVAYPLIPAPPKLLSRTNSGFVLDFNGDVRDIYGVEVRIPAITGNTGVILPIAHITPPTLGTDSAYSLQRSALTRPTLGGQTYNVQCEFQISEVAGVSFQPGDAILVTCPADTSFNGLKIVTLGQINEVGALPIIGWFDRGQPFPDSIGNLSAQVATVKLYSRRVNATITSASITSGVAKITTELPHEMAFGDSIIIGANWASSIQSPPVPYNQDQDSAVFTGVWVISGVPSATELTFFMTSFPDIVETAMVGMVAQLPPGTVESGPVLPPTTISLTDTTALFRRPVFAQSDLSFDLTDSRVQQVLALVTTFAAGGLIPFYAYFFNLTWDYSELLDLTQIVNATGLGAANLGIANLAVNDATKIASWVLTGGKPDGYRVSIADQVTSQVYNQFTLDNPSNPQPLTQFTMTDADFYPPRNITVVPFNSLGDGFGQTIPHTYSPSSSGTTIGNTSGTYTIGCTFNGSVPAQYIMVRVPFDLPVTYYQNLVPSQGWIDVPPTTADMVLSIQKIATAGNTTAPPYIAATEFGTLTFSPGSSKGVFCSTAETFNVGDVLKVIAPVSTSDGIGIGFTISGTKTFGNTDSNGNVVPPVQPGTIQFALTDNLNNWDDFIPAYDIDNSIIGMDLRDTNTMSDSFASRVPALGPGDQLQMSDGFNFTLS